MTVEILVDGPGGRVRVPFARDVVLVGRDRLCDVRLEDRTVSRRHAALRLGDGGVLAEDLSTNGTFVGGERIDGEVTVPFGAALAMGVFSLRVIDRDGEATPVPGEPLAAPLAMPAPRIRISRPRATISQRCCSTRGAPTRLRTRSGGRSPCRTPRLRACCWSRASGTPARCRVIPDSGRS